MHILLNVSKKEREIERDRNGIKIELNVRQQNTESFVLKCCPQLLSKKISINVFIYLRNRAFFITYVRVLLL